MDTFSLYDEPLFSGDLLVGWNPLADELPALVQDDLQKQDHQIYTTAVVDEQIIKSNVAELPTKEESTFPSMCLDTTINLLDFLVSDSPPQQAVSPPLTLELDNSGDFHHDQPSTEELSEMIFGSWTAAAQSDLSVATGNDCLDLSSLQSLTDENSLLNDGDMDSIFSGSNDELSGILSADILSPVSPKDVDDILSLNASSPVSTDTSGSFNSSAEFMSSVSYPTSPYSVDSLQGEETSIEMSEVPSTISMKYLREELLKPPPKMKVVSEEVVRSGRQKSRRPRARYEPYSPPPAERPRSSTGQSEAKGDRSQRKKQQNKDAALRYRQKKREEKSTFHEECEELEKKNKELREKEDSMTREIQYLKDLLSEVYKAKGITKSK